MNYSNPFFLIFQSETEERVEEMKNLKHFLLIILYKKSIIIYQSIFGYKKKSKVIGVTYLVFVQDTIHLPWFLPRDHTGEIVID